MSRLHYLRNKHWIIGSLVAAVGVALARGVAPHLDRIPAACAAFTGELVALAGVIIIAYGINRRMHSPPAGP